VTKTSKTATFRRTYAALSAPKKQLLCWEETNDGGSSEEGKETPMQHHSIGSVSTQDAVYIQDLGPTARRGKPKDGRFDSGLLAVYADGHIRCFSEDLQKCHWDFVMPSQKAEGTSVAYAALASSTAARKAIFSNRPDIAIAEGVDDLVLLIVTKNPVAYTVQFVAVPVVAEKANPRELISLPLPTTGKATKAFKSTFSVHFPTGTLYQLSARKLTTYNLVPSQPTIMTTLPVRSSHVPGAHPTSLLRISSSTVLVATNEEIALYDTKFSSLQASVSIQESNPSTTVSRASTPASALAGASSIGSVFLTTYIQDMDLVMGYSQSGIVGIQLTRSRAETKGGLLIDSLGRGIDGAGPTAPYKTAKSAHYLVRRQERERHIAAGVLRRLREAKALRNVAAFEAAFAEYVGIQLGQSEEPSGGEDTPMVNGDGKDGSTSDKENSVALARREDSAVDGGFDIPESAHKTLRTDFVVAVLSMIFAVTEPTSVDEGQQMTVTMFPSNVLRYLLESGNFSTLFLPLKEGLMKALLAHDATLRALQWFLTTLTDLPAAEILSALELALSPTTSVPEGENSVIFEIHRAEIVRVALLRLATLPASTIIKSFRALTSDALMLLIRLLENELLCEESDEPCQTIGIEDVRIVADLLTCALDAVGMSGLVMAETTDMLQGLMENVEEALDMVEQAADLRGLMEELFRHVDWKDVVNAPPPPPVEEQEEVKGVKEAATERAAPAITDTPTEDTSAPAPTTSKAITLKKQPVALRNNQRKLCRERFAVARTIVGHKKMLSLATTVSKSEMIKQDRPVALSTANRVSPILPLGALALRRIVDPLVGKEYMVSRDANKHRAKGERKETMKREYWREGLAAGAYSVESMVV